MKWYLHACPVCAGDLHDDVENVGWATCFMCARSFPLVGTVDRRKPGAAPARDTTSTSEAANVPMNRKDVVKAA